VYQTTGILRVERSIKDYLWVYLECCSELGRYYRYAARFLDPKFIRLMRPAWGTHVTVVRREIPSIEWPLWNSNGSLVEFRYKYLRTNGKHVWLDADCEQMLDLRVLVGLSRNPEFDLHITVGVMPGEGG